jgi:hypothetical protein
MSATCPINSSHDLLRQPPRWHTMRKLVTETSGVTPSPLFFKYRACSLPRASPTSPLTSSFALLSTTRSCRPLAVPLPAMTRFRRGAKRRLRRRRWRLPHLGNAVARKGAATRAPWRPSWRRPPPLLLPPSHPRRPELPAAWASRRSGGPAARRGAGRRSLPRRLLLLRRLTVEGGRRAARIRKPLLSSRSPPPPRGPARRLLLR